jgi:DNA-binding NtrC family response regulator
MVELEEQLKGRILVVDDEDIKRISLEDQLADFGYYVRSAERAEQGLRLLETESFDGVITDVKMPGMDGLSFLKAIKKRWPSVFVVIITGYATIDDAVEAMKEGAQDYLNKPVSADELAVKLSRIFEYREVVRQNVLLQERLRLQNQYGELLGKSAKMQKTFKTVAIISQVDSNILIGGESGTGKELLARTIHQKSQRRDGPFVAVSCAMLSKQLLESELFGHERGAFTGAIRQKRGRFEMAHKGTLFLDDIDDTTPDIQIKLLRVLQEKSFERVGGEELINVDVRIISAAKRDLEELIKTGQFREDLYFRLNVVPIHLPPLKERNGDVPILVDHFIQKYSALHNRNAPHISPEVMKCLADHSWPGNVRELENVAERCIALSPGDEISVDVLPEKIRNPRESDDSIVKLSLDDEGHVSFNRVVERVEKELILWALKKARNNQARAAETLEIPRTTFQSKLAKFGKG